MADVYRLLTMEWPVEIFFRFFLISPKNFRLSAPAILTYRKEKNREFSDGDSKE